MIQGHIKEVVFASGLQVQLKKDSILIILGPNNSGKSATLNDIKYLLSGQAGPAICLSSLELVRESTIEEVRSVIGQPNQPNGQYSLPGFHFHESNINSWWLTEKPEVGPFFH